MYFFPNYTFYVEKNDSGIQTFSTYSNIVMKVIVCFPFTGEGTSQMSDTPPITNTTSSSPHVSTPSNTIPTETPCPTTTHHITQFVLARLKVIWKKSPCEGRLFLNLPNQTSVPLCFSSFISESWQSELCKDMRCGDFKGFKPTKMITGYVLKSNMTLISEECQGLQITCEGTL